LFLFLPFVFLSSVCVCPRKSVPLHNAVAHNMSE
jgi:hypothetical protein